MAAQIQLVTEKAQAQQQVRKAVQFDLKTATTDSVSTSNDTTLYKGIGGMQSLPKLRLQNISNVVREQEHEERKKRWDNLKNEENN